MADDRHLGKIEKSPYLSNGLTDRREIWRWRYKAKRAKNRCYQEGVGQFEQRF